MELFGPICIISAPSGAGKSTLINQVIKNKKNFIYDIQLSISYTTRPKRSKEIHGQDYFFVSKKQFKTMIRNNIFFEYAQVFNHYYGTSKKTIETMLNSGKHIILNIDWQGAKQIRTQISNVYTIFILPPSQQELQQRLLTRKQDTNKTITNRMKTAINEINHFQEYDYIIINDNLNTALIHLKTIILSEQLRSIHQKKLHNQLIDNLLSIKF